MDRKLCHSREGENPVKEAKAMKDLARQAAEDEDDAMRDAARYARRVRRRLGLSQVEFSERIHVPLETIRNWEQGKRSRGTSPERIPLCRALTGRPAICDGS